MIHFQVFYSDSEKTAAAGFGMVAHLPCIFDGRPGYHRLASRYLIERGRGKWSPKTRGRGPDAERPTPVTIDNYAHWLANFLEWADRRGVDLLTCEYGDVQGRYQEDMTEGRWSHSGKRLKPSTVNPRVDQACDYLTWMADKGLRRPFDIPTETVKVKFSHATIHGTQSKEVTRRIGKIRSNKRALHMPSHEEVVGWLERVTAKFGKTKGLMCETVLHTACRRAEVAAWRTTTLPESRADWRMADPDASEEEQRVLVDITYGAKGRNYGADHGDKIGPTGTVWIPAHFAETLRVYEQKLRNPALKLWISSAPTRELRERRRTGAVHLFLNEDGSGPLTAKDLYNAWTGVELPCHGWSPHLGRDYWACSTLLRELTKHQLLLDMPGDARLSALIESTALSVIRLQIQPQLRHTSESTTMIYLQWVLNRLGTGPSIRYEADLERTQRETSFE